MKRKGVRTEKNDTDDREDEISENASDDSAAEQPAAGKKKKADKRKTGGKKSAKDDVILESDEDSLAENSKKKPERKSTGKKGARRDESDFEQANDSDVEQNGDVDITPKKKSSKHFGNSKKKNAGKRKSSGKKSKIEEDDEVNDAEESEPEQKKKKPGKNLKKDDQKDEDDEQDDEDEEYEVEELLNHRTVRGVKQYLIRWRGYGSDGDTWEAESTLNCPELIKAFKDAKGDKGGVVAEKRGKSKKGTKKKTASTVEVDWSSDDEFEVEKILEVHFKRNGKREFLVSWKGYPPSQDSWEPEENLECVDLINKFMDKVAAAKVVDSKDLRIKRTQTERFTLQMGGSNRRLSRRLGTKQRVQYHDAE